MNYFEICRDCKARPCESPFNEDAECQSRGMTEILVIRELQRKNPGFTKTVYKWVEPQPPTTLASD